jgi:CRP-like cAMP-binding protein
MKNTILIIEDNDKIREATAAFLEQADYHVLQAANGKTGLKMAQHSPDLIICDIMMPKMNGYSLLYMLNTNPEIANIPFLFLTSKYESEKATSANTEILASIESLMENKVKELTVKSKHLKTLERITKESGLNKSKISASFKLLRYHKKQIIYYEGTSANGIYLIIKGHVKTINLSGDGKEIFTGIFGCEEFLGARGVLNNELFLETAETMDETTVCFIPSEEIHQLINISQQIRSKLVKLLSHDQTEEESLSVLANVGVRKRMAGVLLRLAKQSSDTRYGVNISNNDLAVLMGMTEETVTHTLSDFKTEGIIDRSDDKILLLDSIRLLRLKQTV